MYDSSATPILGARLERADAGVALALLLLAAGCGARTGLALPEGGEGPPAETPGSVVAITAGIQFACALDHDGAVWCWGDDVGRELGDGRGVGTPANLPVRVIGLEHAIAVSVSSGYGCAVEARGTAACWASNYDGQLGSAMVGLHSQTLGPVRVDRLSYVTWISAGTFHACALVGGGTAYCWGSNDHGQLGTGDHASSRVPVPVVDLPPAHAICAGGQQTCALTETGDVYCWGGNEHGELGITGTGTSRPTRVPGIPSAAAIACAGDVSCALVADGSVFCWGAAVDSGRGGDGAVAPGRVPLSGRAAAVATGAGHACAVGRSGEVWCWGDNLYSAVGSGPRDQPLPVRVSGVQATSLALGFAFSCALSPAGNVWCWGDDSHGQLGDGISSAPRPTPTQVLGLP